MEKQRVTKQMARFVVMYDTPSDIEAFERHYRYTTIRGMIVHLDDK
jgi:hypothetical protein